VLLAVFIILVDLTSCKKFVQVDPPVTSTSGQTVFSDNAGAEAAMTGIYDVMVSNFSGLVSGGSSISYLVGAQADELKDYSPTSQPLRQFYTNSLSSSTNGKANKYFWPEIYKQLYVANAVLEGLSKSNNVLLSASTRQQIGGEAKFMRAFLQFYATNLYGDVPLVTSTDYLTNNNIHRSPQGDIYNHIVQDLKDAQSALGNDFVDASGNVTSERTRPNKGAASALLARTYLYLGKWDSAEIAATSVLNNSNYALNTDLSSVFLANSPEAIWQFQPVVTPTYNTFDAYYFILTSAPGTGRFNVALSPSLISTFEAGDSRFVNWVGQKKVGTTTYYFPYKYKVGQNKPLTEYVMALRLAEQYLIRAEARAQKGNIDGPSGAIADLNTIRSRAGLEPYNGATDMQSVLAAILHERQVELFTEWGHRWFDLKRTGTLNSVMGSPGNACQLKGGAWSADWALLPLPLSEIQINPNLTQNHGY